MSVHLLQLYLPLCALGCMVCVLVLLRPRMTAGMATWLAGVFMALCGALSLAALGLDLLGLAP